MFVRTKKLYGFEKTVRGRDRKALLIQLNAPSGAPIRFGDSCAEVVEEIIRRNGAFLSAEQTNKADPRLNFCSGYYPLLLTELRPPNPAHAFETIVPLSRLQYEYGMYLKELIKNNHLKAEEVKDRRPGRRTEMDYILENNLHTQEEIDLFFDALHRKTGEITFEEYMKKNHLPIPTDFYSKIKNGSR